MMIDESKLSQLLYDPQARVVVFGLAHVNPATSSAETGATRLRAVLQDLANATQVEQYQSWLADYQPKSHSPLIKCGSRSATTSSTASPYLRAAMQATSPGSSR
jgi:hypothetical protein